MNPYKKNIILQDCIHYLFHNSYQELKYRIDCFFKENSSDIEYNYADTTISNNYRLSTIFNKHNSSTKVVIPEIGSIPYNLIQELIQLNKEKGDTAHYLTILLNKADNPAQLKYIFPAGLSQFIEGDCKEPIEAEKNNKYEELIAKRLFIKMLLDKGNI